MKPLPSELFLKHRITNFLGSVELETYLTIEELADYLKLAEQTVRRWVMNGQIPFHKIKSVIRFRLSEIEKWVDNGGVKTTAVESDVADGGLFGEETDGKETV